MAQAAPQDLVARVRKFREVKTLQHDSIPNIADSLERIMKFLQEHETPSLSDCTHTVFDSYVDWWVGVKPSFKLAIAEDNTIDLLNKYIGELYLLGIPLTLAEKRTPEIRFVQDICIWGKENDTIKAEELLAEDGGFMQVLGKAMGEIYPQSEPSFFLDVVLFDATGFSRTKGVMKTSIRLVWSSIIVDRDRALRIHDYVIHRFSEESADLMKELTTRLLEYNKDNTWANVFSAEVYTGRHNSIRMPLNDRVSLAPMKKPELRPFAPVAVTRCTFQDKALSGIERICDHTGLEGHEWVKIGSIRCDVGTPLTEWTQPVFKGVRTLAPTYPRAGTTYSAARSVTASVAVGGRTSGQVKVRTQGGSDTVRGPQRPKSGAGTDGSSRVREERIMTVEREFDGTVQEFRDKLEAQLGDEAKNFVQDENQLQWKQQDSGDQNGAHLVFKAGNKRVYISGKAYQVRSLLSVILPFARGVGETARSVTHTQRSRTQGGGGYAASGPGSIAPSAIYAPSHISSRAASQAQSISSQTGAGPRSFEPTRRIVARPFEAEGAGEMALNTGDRITITHDPDAEEGKGSNNIHRWVYGHNESTDSRGWFPFSHATEENPAAPAEVA